MLEYLSRPLESKYRKCEISATLDGRSSRSSDHNKPQQDRRKKEMRPCRVVTANVAGGVVEGVVVSAFAGGDSSGSLVTYSIRALTYHYSWADLVG
jgi:hypothetical protein